MILTGEKNSSTAGKTCHAAVLFTTNPTECDTQSSLNVRGENPVTDRLSHGRAEIRSRRRKMRFINAEATDVAGRLRSSDELRKNAL
jgi:hypothetical protein